ncbi:MAG TPA: hypothetical protein VF275_12255 [Gammaproteobacteria bacterium]
MISKGKVAAYFLALLVAVFLPAWIWRLVYFLDPIYLQYPYADLSAEWQVNELESVFSGFVGIIGFLAAGAVLGVAVPNSPIKSALQFTGLWSIFYLAFGYISVGLEYDYWEIDSDIIFILLLLLLLDAFVIVVGALAGASFASGRLFKNEFEAGSPRALTTVAAIVLGMIAGLSVEFLLMALGSRVGGPLNSIDLTTPITEKEIFSQGLQVIVVMLPELACGFIAGLVAARDRVIAGLGAFSLLFVYGLFMTSRAVLLEAGSLPAPLGGWLMICLFAFVTSSAIALISTFSGGYVRRCWMLRRGLGMQLPD